LKEQIADVVPQRVVDLLEPVEVEDDHAGSRRDTPAGPSPWLKSDWESWGNMAMWATMMAERRASDKAGARRPVAVGVATGLVYACADVLRSGRDRRV